MAALKIKSSIMGIAIPFGDMRFIAKRTFSLIKVIFMDMVTLAFLEFEIFYTIIIFNVIYVMNYFKWLKISSQFLFHNKSMLPYVAVACTKRMFWFLDKNISRLNCSTAFPARMIFKPMVLIGTALAFIGRLANKGTAVLTLNMFRHNNIIYGLWQNV